MMLAHRNVLRVVERKREQSRMLDDRVREGRNAIVATGFPSEGPRGTPRSACARRPPRAALCSVVPSLAGVPRGLRRRPIDALQRPSTPLAVSLLTPARQHAHSERRGHEQFHLLDQASEARLIVTKRLPELRVQSICPRVA